MAKPGAKPGRFGRHMTQRDREAGFRKIIKRVLAIDGTEEVTLECGHVTVQIIPLPAALRNHQCAQCINAFVKEARNG